MAEGGRAEVDDVRADEELRVRGQPLEAVFALAARELPRRDAAARALDRAGVHLGFGHIVALHYRSSTLYQMH